MGFAHARGVVIIEAGGKQEGARRYKRRQRRDLQGAREADLEERLQRASELMRTLTAFTKVESSFKDRKDDAR